MKKPKKGLYSQVKKQDKSMYRRDGSIKSKRGFLGPTTNKISGGTMTEFSTDMMHKGKSIDIPTMVPTLSKEEIEYMRSMKPGADWNLSGSSIERTIIDKARKHARERLSKGKSQFYQDGKD